MSAVKVDVSRETMERLEKFAELVIKWNSKINLVASTSDLWNRHIVDSAQVYDLAPKSEHWADIGSGGGFPAIISAIIAKERFAEQRFSLVESDQRKSTFLRTAARELDLNVRVYSERIEKLDPLATPLLSARALAPLSNLLAFAERHLDKSGIALFMKGKSWVDEHEIAQKTWKYHLEPIKSTTDPDAAILRIKDIKRA